MVYIFTMPKISLYWGPLQPFLQSLLKWNIIEFYGIRATQLLLTLHLILDFAIHNKPNVQNPDFDQEQNVFKSVKESQTSIVSVGYLL